jgi:hypothetical protein
MSEFNESIEEARLLALLRDGLAESDPAPSDIAAFAKAALTWRDIEAELAELDFDSAAEDLPTGVRSSATARMLSFLIGQWTLDVEFDEISGRLLGAISPETPYIVDLHSAGTFFTTESDEVGRFQAEGLIRGPLSMVLRFPNGIVFKTQWVVL